MLYFGMAKLGQLLSLPAGNITPVWIASRVILATVLLRGNTFGRVSSWGPSPAVVRIELYRREAVIGRLNQR